MRFEAGGLCTFSLPICGFSLGAADPVKTQQQVFFMSVASIEATDMYAES